MAVIDGERGLGRLSTAPKETARLSNALDPRLMTAAERLAEIGEILAAGLLRLGRSGRKRAKTTETFPSTSPPDRASMVGHEEAEKGHE